MATSIKKRLAVTLVGLTLLTWLASVPLAAYYADRLAANQIDRHLKHYADMAQHTLVVVMDDPDIQQHFQARSQQLLAGTETELRRVRSFTQTETGSAINLWFGDNSQILIGEDSPAFPAPQTEGLVTVQLEDNSRWRVLYRHFPRFNIWQAVGVDLQSARQGGITTLWVGMIPFFIILPATIAILFYGIRKGLRPLHELARQIAARKPHALTPIDISDVPRELKPVVLSLNDLLDRLQRSLASEHRFTANAAHELQTPLSAIQAAVQSCQRQIQEMPGCEETGIMLKRINQRVNRAAETVRQLLTLARLDPDQEVERSPLDIGSLVADVMAEVGDIAMERRISVRFDQQSGIQVKGNAEWLRILLRNLFMNAFRYAPSSSEVEVRLDRQPGYSIVAIENDCAPIPEPEFKRLSERFYHPSTGHDHGAGLGLSIAERIAELHEAQLILRSTRNGNGFLAEVYFSDY